MGAHWKIWFIGGDSRKANIWEGNCLKREGFNRRERRRVFWGGEGSYPNAHYDNTNCDKISGDRYLTSFLNNKQTDLRLNVSPTAGFTMVTDEVLGMKYYYWCLCLMGQVLFILNIMFFCCYFINEIPPNCLQLLQ